MSDTHQASPDTEMLNWMGEHLSSFRQTLRLHEPYNLTWIDDEGAFFVTKGDDMRDCVKKAMDGKGQDTTPLNG